MLVARLLQVERETRGKAQALTMSEAISAGDGFAVSMGLGVRLSEREFS